MTTIATSKRNLKNPFDNIADPFLQNTGLPFASVSALASAFALPCASVAAFSSALFLALTSAFNFSSASVLA